MEKLRLGFLASHGGSNMQAILENIKSGMLDAEPAVLISNNSSSGAMEKAKNFGIPCFHLSSTAFPDEEKLDEEIAKKLEEYKIDLVILAGYMKRIGERVLSSFKGRILNIHPALLPKHGGKGMYGMNVHKAVIEAGEDKSGATIHLVDEQYDKGRILNQMEVPVFIEDTAEVLAERVLKAEHFIYSDTIKKIINGEIILDYLRK